MPRPDGLSATGLTTTSYGKLAEHLAVTELLRRGLPVAIPVADDDGVDLVVSYRWRVQVKNAHRRNVTPNPRSPGCSYDALSWSSKRRWTEADFFLLYGGERWFVVPALVLAGHGATLLTYEGSRSGMSAEVATYEDAWHLLVPEVVAA